MRVIAFQGNGYTEVTAIDATTIGQTTPAAVAATALSSTLNATFPVWLINGTFAGYGVAPTGVGSAVTGICDVNGLNTRFFSVGTGVHYGSLAFIPTQSTFAVNGGYNAGGVGGAAFYVNGDTGAFYTCGSLFAAGALSAAGMIQAVAANKTAAYTLGATDFYVPCDATSGGFTVTLPLLPVVGRLYTIKKFDATSNAITVSANGGTIDAASTRGLNNKEALQLIARTSVSGASVWDVVNNAIAPGVVASIHLTGQASNIGATTAYAVPAGMGGLYRVSAYVTLTRAATTSATLANATMGYTDLDTGVANTGIYLGPSAPSNNVVGYSSVNGGSTNTMLIQAAAGTNINYATVNYASSGATTMQYSLRFIVEYLGP